MIRQKRVISNLLFNMDKTNVIITFKNPNWTVSWPYLTSFQNFFWPLLIFFVFLFMLFGANFEFFIRQPNDSKLNAMPSLKTSLWTQRPIWDPSNLSLKMVKPMPKRLKSVKTDNFNDNHSAYSVVPERRWNRRWRLRRYSLKSCTTFLCPICPVYTGSTHDSVWVIIYES